MTQSFYVVMPVLDTGIHALRGGYTWMAGSGARP